VTNWLNKITNKYLIGTIVEKIIFINIAIFIISYLLKTLSFLLEIEGNIVINWFALKPGFNTLLLKPWTLVSYGFLHNGFFHILFNLLVLYYIGNIFLDFFNRKQFLTYYFLGIISGGIFYMLSYNYLPALKTHETILVGASAGVTSILIGIASYIPQYALRFQFIGNIKLLYIAIVFIVLDIIQIPIGNAGGHLAHLGGALTGYLLTAQFQQSKSLITLIESLFRSNKKKPLKTVYKNEQTSRSNVKKSDSQQAQIDRILDKISKSGYETLSKEEKDFLFKIGKK
jgi:membrane associated rhomboid family serine protease